MKITHEEFKEQLKRSNYKQKLIDEKDFLKREQEIRAFYKNEIRDIEKENIKQLKTISENFKKEINEENLKKIKKYKDVIINKNNHIIELKNEIRRLRERNKKIEKAHVITQSLRTTLLITIDRLIQYDSVVTSNKTSIFQSLNKMKDELDYTITKIKSREDMINEIMLPENELENDLTQE